MNIGKRTVATMLAVVAVLLGRAAPVNASTLVYFESDGAPPDPCNPRGLYTFDTDTGVSTFRAPVCCVNEYFYAMAVRPSDNTVFVVNLNGGLWTIDIDTGATTLIGPTGPTPDRSTSAEPSEAVLPFPIVTRP